MFAQIGLGADPTGGIVVILLVGVLAVAGLVICVVSGINLFRSTASGYKALMFFFLGLGLTSPALWFAYMIFGEEIPRTKAWDFSSSRSVTQLEEERSKESYYYQGNLHSSVKLAPNRQWSGNAYLVVFKAREGKITEIHWRSRPADTPGIYADAKRIVKELAMADRDLDSWYAKVRRGEQASFSALDGSDAGSSIEVLVRSLGKERDEEPSWAVHVNVRWNED